MLGDPEVLLEAPRNPGAPEASAVEKTPRTHAQVYQGELGACPEALRSQVEERGALTETGQPAQQPQAETSGFLQRKRELQGALH